MAEKDKKVVRQQAKQKFEESWTNFEGQLKVEWKVPLAVLLGISFFAFFHFVFVVFSWVPMMLLGLLLPLLRFMHVTRIVTVTKEVEQLVL